MRVRAHTCVSATRGERWRRSHGHTVGDEADEGVGEGAAASGTPVLARHPSPDAPGAPGGRAVGAGGLRQRVSASARVGRAAGARDLPGLVCISSRT